jgi:hypothetical protein
MLVHKMSTRSRFFISKIAIVSIGNFLSGFLMTLLQVLFCSYHALCSAVIMHRVMQAHALCSPVMSVFCSITDCVFCTHHALYSAVVMHRVLELSIIVYCSHHALCSAGIMHRVRQAHALCSAVTVHVFCSIIDCVLQSSSIVFCSYHDCVLQSSCIVPCRHYAVRPAVAMHRVLQSLCVMFYSRRLCSAVINCVLHSL